MFSLEHLGKNIISYHLIAADILNFIIINIFRGFIYFTSYLRKQISLAKYNGGTSP